MITVDVSGIEGVQELLRRMPEAVADAFAAGAEESAQEILQTVGLQQYPPSGPANEPPTPYWIRHRGMQRGGVRIPEYNDLSSEDLGNQFYTERRGRWTVAVGNRAKYAPFVIGAETQAGAMASIGWRTLLGVATEKEAQIVRIVTAWIEREIQRNRR